MSEPTSAAEESSGTPRRRARWLLLGSLALNLFFLGIAVAMLVRGPPPSPPHWRHHNVFERVDRLADALPPADGKIVRDAMNSHHAAIAKAQEEFHDARNAIRATLRQQPFKEDAMRAAMAKMRAARQSFDELIQGVFADAAAKMSTAGRQALADWPRSRRRDRRPR
jgi:uncharacterized membrane protein